MNNVVVLLNMATPFASLIVLVRSGCILNRMRLFSCPPLMLAYFTLALSSFSAMLAPFYKGVEAIAYPAFILCTAAILVFDRRLLQSRTIDIIRGDPYDNEPE